MLISGRKNNHFTISACFCQTIKPINRFFLQNSTISMCVKNVDKRKQMIYNLEKIEFFSNLHTSFLLQTFSRKREPFNLKKKRKVDL